MHFIYEIELQSSVVWVFFPCILGDTKLLKWKTRKWAWNQSDISKNLTSIDQKITDASSNMKIMCN